MKLICLVLGILTLLVTASAQKAKKAPDIEVMEAKARRGEDKISLDGRVKVSGEKPLKGLILAFDFLSSSGDVLTTQKQEISDDTLDRNEEAPFHSELLNPPGAIKFRIRAFDSSERELRSANAGPFTIE
jgi:hypothetical protein